VEVVVYHLYLQCEKPIQHPRPPQLHLPLQRPFSLCFCALQAVQLVDLWVVREEAIPPQALKQQAIFLLSWNVIEKLGKQ
jgi:hypothetical protein